MKRGRTLLLFSTLSLCACASSGPVGKEIGPSPRNSPGFPSQTFEEDALVYAQASFKPGHKQIFGRDLIARNGIVPIALDVRVTNQGERPVLITDERMNARLYLPDGTSLNAISGDELASQLSTEQAQIVRSKAFHGSLLDSERKESFLFFQLAPPGSFRIDGVRLRHVDGGIERNMLITRSLLAFDVMVDDRALPFYVGLGR